MPFLDSKRSAWGNRVAMLTATGAAVAGMLAGAAVLSARLGPIAGGGASAPCLGDRVGPGMETCYCCLTCTPERLPNHSAYLFGHYPGQDGARIRMRIRICDACWSRLDAAGQQRALENWIAAEVTRIREGERESLAQIGIYDEFLARIRQARLEPAQPDG